MLKENVKMMNGKEEDFVRITSEESGLKIAICDDEKAHIEELKKILYNIKGNGDMQVETCSSAGSFLNTLKDRDTVKAIFGGNDWEGSLGCESGAEQKEKIIVTKRGKRVCASSWGYYVHICGG